VFNALAYNSIGLCKYLFVRSQAYDIFVCIFAYLKFGLILQYFNNKAIILQLRAFNYMYHFYACTWPLFISLAGGEVYAECVSKIAADSLLGRS